MLKIIFVFSENGYHYTDISFNVLLDCDKLSFIETLSFTDHMLMLIHKFKRKKLIYDKLLLRKDKFTTAVGNYLFYKLCVKNCNYIWLKILQLELVKINCNLTVLCVLFS